MRISLFEPFMEVDLPLPDRRDGKVRTSWSCGDARRLIVTTDRLSAFDRVLAGVPYKGQVLNQLSAWWFEQTADIVPNHLVSVPDPNATVAIEATPLPIEVVVRGYITGVTDTSLWGQYERGSRSMYGYDFPDGLRKNRPLPTPIITPTTKAEQGGHDEPVRFDDVVERGLLDAELWNRVIDIAHALFARGSERGAASGLVLADTKYEFGVTAEGALILIDEVHTPDSSRWWVGESYEARIDRGDEPESLDKEVVRRVFAELGYTGDGPIPDVPGEVWSATSARYIVAYERLTGLPFEPFGYPIEERLRHNLTEAGIL